MYVRFNKLYSGCCLDTWATLRRVIREETVAGIKTTIASSLSPVLKEVVTLKFQVANLEHAIQVTLSFYQISCNSLA